MTNAFAWLRQRLRQRGDSEHAQALVRIVMIALILCYVLLSAGRWSLPPAQLRLVIALILIAQGLSLALMGWLLWKPGRSDLRRILGMVDDYALMSAAMSTIGEPMACIYVVVMWVTVGNGMRFGNRYLMLAVVMATASFGITLALSDYWQRNLGLGIGLLVGLAAIPLYFSSLLRQLTEAMAEARRASDAKSRFLANMSHEFRTPLNGLSGMTELLATTRLDEEQRECLGTIQASARTLLALVEEVLDISAIEAGKLRISAQDFSLAELVQSIGLILGPQARVKRLDYRVFVESGVPDGLHGDVGHLRQILLNLAGNAVKFTDQGQVEIRVSVSPSGEDGPLRLRFEILDTGIGVAPSLRPRLFDAFEQADVSMARRHEGTGLGTAIAKGLAQAMGGQIGYRENLPVGSCFWVELPLGRAALAAADGEAAAAAEPLAVEDPGNVIAFTDPFRRHRARVRSLDILVADDHEANRMVLQRLLQKAGHRVTCVHGAEQALDAMAARDFDVAITDLHMPGMSGLDLLRQLRVMQAGGGARTPVVILSADVTPEAIQRCNQAGAHAFMAKPVVAARLLETMADIASGATAGSRDMAAVVPAVIDGDAVLDTGVLDELAALGMGKGFEREFVRQCLEDLESGIGALPGDAQAQDWTRMREHAHAIKGVAANLGLLKVARQGGELMRMADWQLKGEWKPLHARIGAALQEGRQALDARARGRAQSHDDVTG
ncbi:MAG: response regulator [Stenotrophomonas nitritireducens]|uniref:response regulator n=1 Tax=Stenotrophomonas nitritireducens TaxID=83617 RepID=UPI001AC2368B|nr:response regulator [Stenotrophomonas nitritireducens]MBN8768673.1 response regulator [Stenotrophomonas sp.]MBN8791941.1 response regulator [Stenotrophomonas nitritireducens]